MRKSEVEIKIKNILKELQNNKQTYLKNDKKKELKSNLKYYKEILKLYNFS